jgi:DNA mismatch endonuclease (patch repair protein)
LPGTPDIVMPRFHLVIFVHGCFWHHHCGCKRAPIPKSNQKFWEEKFRRNQERDAAAINQLVALGWNVAVIWECETCSQAHLEQILGVVLARCH